MPFYDSRIRGATNGRRRGLLLLVLVLNVVTTFKTLILMVLVCVSCSSKRLELDFCSQKASVAVDAHYHT